MKITIRQNLLLATFVSVLLGFMSCSSDKEIPIEEENNDADGRTLLVMRISPVDAVSAERNGGVHEKIKSLRIVMVSDDNYIEVNEKIDFTRSQYEVDNFNYVYTKRTPVGEKKFYLFANEESIGSIGFDGSVSLPADMPTDNLSDLLDWFEADEIPEVEDNDSDTGDSGTPDAGSGSLTEPGNGSLFEEVMGAVYFTPDYSTAIDGNNVIYLPYTAFYGDIEIEEDENGKGKPYIETEMFLVPAAAKISFNFNNYRLNNVALNSIKIGGIALQNFVHAQVGSGDLNKKIGSKTYWWIDWLQQIASASKNYPGAEENNEFNNLNGWINSFSVPSGAYPNTTDDIIPGWLTLINGSENHQVGPKSSAGPGKLPIGPYYLPESCYLVEREVFENGVITSKKVQEYYLTMDLEDISTSTSPEFQNITIGNLKSLFRATSIIINVDLRDAGDASVYAEFQPWNVQPNRNGVIEEEDILP